MRYLLSINPRAKARLYTCGENIGSISHLIDAGVLDAWQMDARQHPFETVKRAAEGYWPADVNDPLSKLLPPTKETYLKYDAFFYEGLESMGDYIMGSYAEGGLANLAGMGTRVGPGSRPGDDAVSFKDGSVAVGGNSMSHYNTGQRWMHGAVILSKRHPGHIVWTSKECIAIDKDLNPPKPVLGPEVIGSAATPKVPGWFDQTLRLVVIPKEIPGGKIVNEYRLYLKRHQDFSNPKIPCLAQVRFPLELQAEMDTLFPEYLPLDAGTMPLLMGKIMSAREKAAELTRALMGAV